MPILNKPDMNYGVWAEGGNIEIPSSEKVEEGWVIEKPLNETMNWLQNRQDRMLQYINERGIPEWDSRTQYPLDAFVARSGTIYKSLSPNTDKDPTLYTSIWQIAFVSYSDFIDYSDKIDSIENDEGYLGLYVSKASPVLDAPAKGVAYNNKTSDTGYGFNEDTPVINNKGKAVAEFSGGNNPKDVVTHEQLALAIQVFKVGSVYTTTTNENPSITFGYGAWERFAKGKALVGFTDEVSNSIPQWVKIAGTNYGEYEHKLTVEELPPHNHDLNFTTGNISGNNRAATQSTSSSMSNLKTLDTGGGKGHNNVQPSIVVYFWKRIA